MDVAGDNIGVLHMTTKTLNERSIRERSDSTASWYICDICALRMLKHQLSEVCLEFVVSERCVEKKKKKRRKFVVI